LILSKKHHKSVQTSTADLSTRVQRTRNEGRFQQALELAKQLHKAEPTPAHLELLKDTYLKRAAQLRAQGYNRDAATVLEVASRLDERNTAWLEKIATELALAGDVARSTQMLHKLPDGISPATMARLADAAFLEKNGRAALPASMQAEYDCIVTAFKQVEGSQDEQAKTTLQAIGLRSPFLEWKLLLRGCQAYYQRDDERARENWQRLDPQRVPARLAAPLRLAIDPAYRDAQAPATQQALRQQFDWLQGSSLMPQMRSLRTALNDQDSLAQAFRIAENVMPTLKQQAPHLVPRLANCMYWAILRTGPDELPRFKRVFGPPPDDPNFNRLTALAHDSGGDLTVAHDYWQRLDKEIAQKPQNWPGDQLNVARALVWLRMGKNAASIPPPELRESLPRFLRDLDALPKQLKPGAEACFKKALELAPNLLEAHTDLFHFHQRHGNVRKAIDAGLRLLELFPDHVQTFEEVAELLGQEGKHNEELNLLQKALGHNPLDRDLRERIGKAHLDCARADAEKKRFDPARAHYQSALQYSEAASHGVIACCQAACELKAGDENRANELLAEARAKAPGEMLVTYALLVEAIRLRLPQAVKTRFTQEFNSAVADRPTPELARGLLGYLVDLDENDVTYHGQKTHTKKIYDFVGRLELKACNENDFVAILGFLVRLDSPVRMTTRFLNVAQQRFPKNPFVYYYEAVHVMGDAESPSAPPMRALWLLEEAERLAQPRAAEPAVKTMLEDLSTRRTMLMSFRSLLGGMFGGMFGGPDGFPFGGMFDDDDFVDDYDDDDDDGFF
jgi:tetratricopeptide (TPR) repeat protein